MSWIHKQTITKKLCFYTSASIVLAVFFCVFGLFNAKNASAATHYCSSCEECNQMIQDASSWDTVVLTASLTECSGACIDFVGKDEITFDCNGNTIFGVNSLFQTGIYLGAGSNNNTIKNCTIKEFGTGIKIDHSQENEITDTTSEDNLNTGIFLNYANNNQLTSVSAIDNYHGGGNSCGFRIERSHYNTLDGIIASGHRGEVAYGGIYLSRSNYNNLNDSNFFDNEKYGIYIRWSSNFNVIRNTTITTSDKKHGGLYVYSHTNQSTANDIDTSNTIDGKPIQFFDSYYKLCPGSGTIMEYGDVYSMVHLYNCNDITLRNTSLESGLFIWSTNNSEIYNVDTNDNRNGVVMWSSDSNNLTNVTTSNNSSSGIYMRYSDYNNFSGAASSYSDENGISIMNSNYNTFTDYAFNNNGGWGIYARYGSHNNINNSSIEDNISGGVRFGYDSDNNTIEGCQIKNNLGLYFFASSGYGPNNNLIYNNYFENGDNFVFFGAGYSNEWSIPQTPGTNILGGTEIGGNYWGRTDGMGFSQTCVDNDSDGFCDDNNVLDPDNIDLLPLAAVLSPLHTISGTIDYYDGLKTVPNATVILKDSLGNTVDTTITNTNGYYEFTDIPTGEDYTISITKEDISTGITGSDITAIAQHIVGINYFTSIFQTIAADVNETESVTGADITMIAQYIVGLITELDSGDWKFYSTETTPTETNYLTEGMERTINLTSNATDQDFIGVKMGDANGSWSN